MAGLHQLPLADTDPDARSQRAGWRARYSGEEGEFLDRWLPEERGAVLLHLDLTDENVFIEAGRLTGILDFAGASTGDRAMELAAPGVFLVQGDHHLLRTMVRAAGLPDADPRERLAWHLLHPYSQLPRDLALCNAGEVHGLDEAAERIWG